MPKKTRAKETDKFNIYYPEQDDKVDIAGDFEQLALSVEAALDNLEVDGTPGLPLKTYDDLSAIGDGA